MKKTITIIAGVMLAATTVKSQTGVSTFETLILPADSFYTDTTGADFMSDDATFQYDWSQSPWGDYWSGGFVYTNMTDSVTSGYTNMYSAKTAVGFNNSSNYVVGMNYSGVKVGGPIGNSAFGFFVTNSTYAYNSMRDGDMFAKKFGGPSGNDPDWFKLTVFGYNNGVMINDSAEFYLADFRFSNNGQDYIIKTWEFVDISAAIPGQIDSVSFLLSSSDVGGFGMNTPGYFCMDNFESIQAVIGMTENPSGNVSLYPNPANSEINISLAKPITIIGICSITNVTGTEVLSVEVEEGTSTFKLDVTNLEKGVYFLRINTGEEVIAKKFIKE